MGYARSLIKKINNFPEYQILIKEQNEQQTYTQQYKSQLNSLAPIHNDIPHKDDIDSLAIDKDVNAFAKLITYKDLPTPLSIGLFGKWGSGKSFFMEKLSSQIDYYSEHKDEDTFCKDIVHVKFNAWHYSDTNLWASLVYKIFQEIDEKINKKTSEDLSESAINSLYQELKSSKKAIKEKELEEKELQREIDDLSYKLQENENLLKETENSFKSSELVDIGELVLNEDSIKEDVDAIKQDLKDNNNLDFESIQKIYSELATFIGTIKQLMHLIKEDSKFRYFFFIILVMVICVTGVTYYLGNNNLLTSVVAFIGSGIFYIKFKANKIKPVFDKIDIFIKNYNIIKDKKRHELYDDKLEKKRLINKLNNELEDIKSTQNLLNKEKENIEKNIQDIKEGKLFKDFILDRISSNDYSQHLGLISLIRDDFMELQKFLLSEVNNKKYNIDRIVLYIDDLDRCSDNLVIDVLEAIHLLLAFKLFVVIVGVDSRWIQGSLKNKYQNFLNQKSNITPKQYLEKIFQIPFKVKDLSNDDKQKFVKEILKNNIIDLDEKELESKTLHHNMRHKDMTDKEAEDLGELLNKLEEEIPKKMNIHKELKLMPKEIKYIEKLSNFFGDTPREIKRYVNIYRIIRSHDDIVEIIDNNFEDFKIVLLLLTQVILKEQNSKSLAEVMSEMDIQHLNSFDKDKKNKLNDLIQRFSFDNLIE